MDPEVMLGSNADSKSKKRAAMGRDLFLAGARSRVKERQTSVEYHLCEICHARCYLIVTISH